MSKKQIGTQEEMAACSCLMRLSECKKFYNTATLVLSLLDPDSIAARYCCITTTSADERTKKRFYCASSFTSCCFSPAVLSHSVASDPGQLY